MDGLNFAELLPLIARLSEDPEAMKAISGLMGAMNVQKSEPPPKKETQSDPLSAILSMMGGKGGGGADAGKNAQSDASDVTRNLLNALGGDKSRERGDSGIGKLFGTQEEMKNRILLLNAVRPYLSEGRREKLETVIKLLKLAELGTLGSLLK